MITIKIDTVEQQFDDFDESWVLQQINRRRHEGDPVCVVVKIDEPNVKMILATKECRNAGGAARTLTREEEKVVERWRKHRLDEPDFAGGELLAFLKQLSRLL